MKRLESPVTPRDHALGPEDAPVTLVAYTNYVCLHCRRIHPLLEEIRREHGDRLRIVHRHFARNADLPLSEEAAEAAEAAGEQGRFWEMHAALFAGSPLTERALAQRAVRAALDVARWKEDVRAHRHAERIQEDVASGLASGVRGTPTIFINGRMHEDSWDLEGLREAVAAEVERTASAS